MVDNGRMTTLEAILSEASGLSKLQTEFVKSVAPSFSMTNFAAQFSDYQRMQAAQVQSWQSVMAPSRAVQKIQTQLASSSTAPGHLGQIGADLASAGVPAQVAAPFAKLADQVAEMHRARVAQVVKFQTPGIPTSTFRKLQEQLAQSPASSGSWVAIADDLAAAASRSFGSAAAIKNALDQAAKLNPALAVTQLAGVEALRAQASTIQKLQVQVTQSLMPRLPTFRDVRPEGTWAAELDETVRCPNSGQEAPAHGGDSPEVSVDLVVPLLAALAMSVFLFLAWQALADTATQGIEVTWLLIQLLGAADSTNGGHGVFILLAFALPHLLRGPQRPESD